MLPLRGITESELKPELVEGEECRSLRFLWEEVFYEDSREFTDYYFCEKAVRNQGYVLRVEEKAAAMLYLSPCPVMLRRGIPSGVRKLIILSGLPRRRNTAIKAVWTGCSGQPCRICMERDSPLPF